MLGWEVERGNPNLPSGPAPLIVDGLPRTKSIPLLPPALLPRFECGEMPFGAGLLRFDGKRP